MSGMDQLIPIFYGTLYVIVNAFLLLFALIFDRHYVGLATFVNLFLLGYVVEFTYAVLQSIFPDPSMVVRCGSILLGFLLLSFSSSMYFTADLGVSAYDSIALILSNKWKIGKFKFIRMIHDFCSVILAFVLFLLGKGAAADIPTFVGIGTILTAFLMGPLIDFFNCKVFVPFLEKGQH